MRFWNWFYSAVTVTIVVGMMVPHYFGLESYTQWGGMYTSGWCGAHVKVTDDNGVIQEEHDEYKQAAYMHNYRTCMIWAYKWCNFADEGKPPYNLVQPRFRDGYPFDAESICDFTEFDQPWFTTM